MPDRHTANARHSAPPAIHYRISATEPYAHIYHVQLTVAHPAAGQQLALPVWIPGSYLVREFSRNLHSLQATQDGRPVTVTALAKNRWQTDCTADAPLVLEYRVYAFDNSVRTAWLDDARGFFNATSLCLRVLGQEDAQHVLLVPPPSQHVAAAEGGTAWQLATALQPVSIDDRGFGEYRAGGYDELADSPVEMGAFWSGSFEACGVPHRFVVAGAGPRFDGERLLADARRICETAIRFWHPDIDQGGQPPHDRYVFLLNAVGSGYGGLEHRHSTALICSRADLPRQGDAPQPDGYGTLLGLISHEYFHTWNVKRMRPTQFARYDYDQENYTELLWFFEGFTSYYDDLLLRRAGLLDDAGYLKLLGKTLHQVAQTPGRQVQSVAQASFDAWVKYYRQDENTANLTVSYYTKGALVALCLDLSLRQQGRTDLDAVMRALWQRSQGGPISEDDVLQALQALSGQDWRAPLAAWVHGTDELPLGPLLARQGITLGHKTPGWALRLGIQVQERSGASPVLRRIQSGSLAEQAGLAVHDEWLGVRLPGGSQDAADNGSQAWRLTALDDLETLLPAGTQRFDALLARDGRLLWRTVALDGLDAPDIPGSAAAAQGEVELGIADAGRLQDWLGKPAAAR
ncbi:M61 family peptidase [Corticibacter populi]|uniref:M61 family peptidase n=1 Tax=Corticibacter populi TaxID=1550736 RepID=A0A3M6QTS2_9BURK|nr:M61 family metallopeptidase [Corticibacter populi]RMX06435.1 M61 family peptidase [Corticibacter populi]RZS32013.1 putative metalloprotease with PDZ domain [Corticibacter populi]